MRKMDVALHDRKQKRILHANPLVELHYVNIILPVPSRDAVRGSDHGVSFLPGDGEPIVVNFELMGAIVERQPHARLDKSPVQITRDRLSGPLGRILELLPVRRVRIGFGQEVTVAVLVERVLRRVNGRRLAGQRRVLLNLILLFFKFAIGIFRRLSFDASASFRRRLGLLGFFFRFLRLTRARGVIAGWVEQRGFERFVVGTDFDEIPVHESVFQITAIRLIDGKHVDGLQKRLGDGRVPRVFDATLRRRQGFPMFVHVRDDLLVLGKHLPRRRSLGVVHG